MGERRLLMKKSAFLYTKAFSDFGNILESVVLSSTILTVTHSIVWLSAFYVCVTLGGLLSSLYAGVLADRHSRKTFMILSDLTRGFAVLLIILFPTPLMILAMAFCIGLMGSFFQISFGAEIPQIFGEEQALKVNSLISRLGAISLVTGFFVSVALAHVPFRVVLSIDLLSFILSALMITNTKWVSASPKLTLITPKKEAHPLRNLVRDLVDVKNYLWVKPLLLLVFLIFLTQTFAASAHNMGIPILASHLNRHNVMFYQGLIWGTWGIGSVLSSLVLPKIKKIQAHLAVSYWVMAVFMSLGFISFLSSNKLAIILPLAFFTGIFDAACSTLLNTLIQTCENIIRGRIFGVASLLNRGGFFTGFLLCPFVIGHLGMAHTVWIFHGLVVTVTLVIILQAVFRQTIKKNPTVSALEKN
jgi:MFS family permease